ncbi:NAD(P)/FAD-dependent oxidoreductase [Streptomyces sp. NPDC101165]|uniref:NAD(P)/FAD-dependent oxidoreductase n=1 Tax=Streptomyces sp. NPDC101165 TaxID=3366119 RepID=UPI003807718B
MTPGAGETVCDVVIAGSGPAGSATALTLVRQGASVILADPVVADPGRRQEWKLGESLAPRARPLLERLRVLDRVADGPHTPCLGNQSSWGGGELADSDFLYGMHGPGWHLDRAYFDRALFRAACDAGAGRSAHKVRAVRRIRDHWRLMLGAETVRARYLIDATGAGAGVARCVGAAVRRDDRLIALAARLAPSVRPRPPSLTSLVESAAPGWWYTAPLPDGTSLAMLMTDADVVAGHAFHRPRKWWEELMATTHVRARVDHSTGPAAVRLRVVRAATSHTCPAAGPGWAAVGDAATASDPIAGRGILTALATGVTAAEAVGADAAGDQGALGRYAARVEAIHAEYLDARRLCYRAEERWDTPFWTRRRSRSPERPRPGG